MKPRWSANFSDTNNCIGTLILGRSCRINVRFAPTTIGVLTGTLTITDSDPTSPQIVQLTGTAVAPALSMIPTALTFASTVGVASPAQQVTVSNTGTAAFTINSINLNGANPGQFAQTNTCGTFPAALAVGGSCTVSVTSVFDRPDHAATQISRKVALNPPAISFSLTVLRSGTIPPGWSALANSRVDAARSSRGSMPVFSLSDSQPR